MPTNKQDKAKTHVTLSKIHTILYQYSIYTHDLNIACFNDTCPRLVAPSVALPYIWTIDVGAHISYHNARMHIFLTRAHMLWPYLKPLFLKLVTSRSGHWRVDIAVTRCSLCQWRSRLGKSRLLLSSTQWCKNWESSQQFRHLSRTGVTRPCRLSLSLWGLITNWKSWWQTS